MSGLVSLLEAQTPVAGLVVLYLLAVLPIAFFWGTVLAVLVSLASTAVFSFFFLPPTGSFNLTETDQWIGLATFLIVAVVVSELAARSRREYDD